MEGSREQGRLRKKRNDNFKHWHVTAADRYKELNTYCIRTTSCRGDTVHIAGMIDWLIEPRDIYDCLRFRDVGTKWIAWNRVWILSNVYSGTFWILHVNAFNMHNRVIIGQIFWWSCCSHLSSYQNLWPTQVHVQTWEDMHWTCWHQQSTVNSINFIWSNRVMF